MSALIERLAREAIPQGYPTIRGLADDRLLVTEEVLIDAIKDALRAFQAEAAKVARERAMADEHRRNEAQEHDPLDYESANICDYGRLVATDIAAKIEAL